MSNYTLTDALKTIKEHCEMQQYCSTCRLSFDNSCTLMKKTPGDWEIKEKTIIEL